VTYVRAAVSSRFAGAAAGAAIGTLIFPGVGTAIGAIVGGGLASGFGAEPLGDVLTGWYESSAAEEAVHDVWEDLFG